ncbi:MAG: endonuclease VIII [Gammaproteobacteria bacterium]|nr:endonuclease VIII [Gammaproteobacteria bacterium]
MPEGPEIRLAADRVEAALAGRRIDAIEFAFEHLQAFERRLRGQVVTRVDTRGKAMLTRIDNGWTIYSHNQLYGRWYVCARGETPRTGRQLRLAIHNDRHSALLYSASEIDVLADERLLEHPFLARIGPDLLSENPGVEQIVERLQARRFRGRQLGALLLDQGFVAGLGNYLRAEILTLARLHPLTRPADCSAAQLRRLAQQIIRLTRRSYRTRGIVNPPSLVARLKAAGYTRREQYRFNTYGRDGEQCHYCEGIIEQAPVGGRKMYYCPVCQPRD